MKIYMREFMFIMLVNAVLSSFVGLVYGHAIGIQLFSIAFGISYFMIVIYSGIMQINELMKHKDKLK